MGRRRDPTAAPGSHWRDAREREVAPELHGDACSRENEEPSFERTHKVEPRPGDVVAAPLIAPAASEASPSGGCPGTTQATPFASTDTVKGVSLGAMDFSTPEERVKEPYSKRQHQFPRGASNFHLNSRRDAPQGSSEASSHRLAWPRRLRAEGWTLDAIAAHMKTRVGEQECAGSARRPNMGTRPRDNSLS